VIVLLATDEMLATKPASVEVKHNWGHLSIVVGDDIHDQVEGTHIAIEGSEESIKNWLRRFDQIWIGVGSPQLQEFEVRHIKED
jgi:hypothetical protein